jgi:hypothetical protein
MPDMTDEEAEYWDEFYTRNTIMPDVTKPGFFARQRERQQHALLTAVDNVSVAYITPLAEASQQPPAERIGKLVRKELVAEI